MKTLAEEMVTTLQRLRQEALEIETWLRWLRQGHKLGTREAVTVKTLRWLKTNEYRDRPIPDGMAQEFYSFLKDKLGRTWDEILRVEAQLEALSKVGGQS